MAQGKRANVRMQFNDGSAFDEWLSLELRDTYTDPLGDLKFEAAPGRARIREYQTKLQKGELITLFINDVNQGTYLIQTVDTTVDARAGVLFSVSCVTPLITPYQGSVTHPLTFKSQTYAPVSEVLLRAFGPYGFDTLIGDGSASVNALTGIPVKGGKKKLTVDALKIDQASAQEGETAYQFGARIVTRLGVCIRSSPEGTILVDAPDYEQAPAYSLVQSDDPRVANDHFFDSIHVHDTNDNQFSECRVRGTRSDKSGSTQTAQPVATVKATDALPERSRYKSVGTADAPSPAGYKPLDLVDKNATSIERCASVAKLALGIRAKDAYTIEGMVDGFVSTTGRIWTTNTIVNVRIDALGINEPMFLLERVLSRSRDGGDACRLKLIPTGALVLGDLPSGA